MPQTLNCSHRGLICTNAKQMQIVILLIWLALMLALLSIIVQVCKVHQHSHTTNRKKLQGKYKRLGQYKFHLIASKAAINSPGYAGLWHQLLIRVQFDIPTAERLVAANQRKYPGKSDRWCIQKAIYDLERDRR